MSVKAIRLQNFMPFVDTDWIELRSITLLFGRNSSGKSAIIRALRLLKQSLAAHGQPLRFVTDHGVDLGSFRTAVHQQQDNLTISFSFQCHIPEVLDILRERLNQWREVERLPQLTAQDMESGLGLRLGFGWNRDQGTVELTEMQLDCLWLDETESMLLFAQRLDFATASELGYDWWFDSRFAPVQQINWDFAAIETPIGFLPTLVGFEEFNSETALPLNRIVEQLGQDIAAFLESIEYLGPMRPAPQRAYLLNEATRYAWRQEGWSAFVDFLDNKIDATRLTEIDNWLDYLQLAEKITDPKTLFADESIALAQIRLKENQAHDLEVNLLDVGYGTVQVLPIIVQSVASRQAVSQEQPLKWIIIEQPELHLHPGAQANLGDLFVSVCQLIVGNTDVNIRFLLETHSEYLLLRLRRRIAETTAKTENLRFLLRQENLVVWFVGRKQGTCVSQIGQIAIDEQGEMISAPEEFEDFDGFFSDDVNEIAKIVKAKRAIRMGK